METNATKRRIQWGSGGQSVRIDGQVDHALQGADLTIMQILSDQHVPCPHDWDRVYPYSAEITDEILQTIRARRAAVVAAIETRMNRPVKRCKKCGHTSGDGAMFSTGGGNVCDDCF